MIPLCEFYELLRRCPAGVKLLLVDTCQTVSSGQLDVAAIPAPPIGVAILFACSPHEGSYEHDSLKHGVFSNHVLRALEGAADENHDGVIALDEFFQFTLTGVRTFLVKEMPESQQTPSLINSLPGTTPVFRLEPGHP